MSSAVPDEQLPLTPIDTSHAALDGEHPPPPIDTPHAILDRQLQYFLKTFPDRLQKLIAKLHDLGTF